MSNPNLVPKGVLNLPSEIKNPLIQTTAANQATSNPPSQFNPLLYPPDIEKAKEHGKSTRVSNQSSLDPFSEVLCECCERNINNRQLPLNCSFKDLYPFRFCTPLYFHMARFSIFLLLVLLFVFGIYGLTVNEKGSYSGELHSDSFENKASVLQIFNNSEYLFTQTVLAFVVVVLFVALFQRLRDGQTKIAQECQEEVVSPSDYAIKITRLHGLYLTEMDIRDFFLVNKIVDNINVIKKVILTYDIKELTNLHRRRLNLIRFRNKLLVIQPEDVSNDYHYMKNLRIIEIDRELQEIQLKLTELEDNCMKNSQDLKFSGTAIVILDQLADVKKIKQKLKMTNISWLFVSFFSKYGYFDNYKLKGRLVRIHPMPDPVDILWENFGKGTESKGVRLLKINLVTFIVMMIGAGIEFGVSYYNLLQTKKGNSSTFLSWLASFVVVIVNAALVYVIRGAASAEKHGSYTGYHLSVAEKLIFNQFINTAIIPNLVHILVYMMDPSGSIEILDSLAYDMFFVFLSNAIASPLSLLFRPSYLLKLYKRYKLTQNPKHRMLIQAEANALFEGPEFDISASYASVIKTMWLTALYAPLIPLCIPISIGGLLLKYWVDKYIFLRRCTSPQLMGRNLAKMMVKYLQLAPCALAIGSLIINICATATGEQAYSSIVVSIVGVFVSVVHVLTPVRVVYKKVAKPTSRDLSMALSYDMVKYRFPTDYERSNPVSQASAEEEHLAGYISTLGDGALKRDLQGSLANMKHYHSSYRGLTRNLQNYVMQNGDLREVYQSYAYGGHALPKRAKQTHVHVNIRDREPSQDQHEIALVMSQMLPAAKFGGANQQNGNGQPANPPIINNGYAFANQPTMWFPSFQVNNNNNSGDINGYSL